MPTHSVALIDSDAAARRELADRLTREDFEVWEGSLSDQPVPAADVVVLGVTGPDGLSHLSAIRATLTSSLVAMIDGDIVPADALDLGADDVVTKPFTPREFVARIRAVLRRGPDSSAETTLQFGELEITATDRRVRVDGEDVAMPAREYDLLEYLASAPGHVFSREQLLQQVWMSTGDWQGTATVTEHVRRLRKRLDPNDPNRWIETVRSVGYRFRRP